MASRSASGGQAVEVAPLPSETVFTGALNSSFFPSPLVPAAGNHAIGGCRSASCCGLPAFDLLAAAFRHLYATSK